MNHVVHLTKMALLAFYAVVLASLFVPFLTEYRMVLWVIAAFLILVHAGEYLAMKSKMVSAAPEQKNHFIKTLLFGYGHWLPLLRKR